MNLDNLLFNHSIFVPCSCVYPLHYQLSFQLFCFIRFQFFIFIFSKCLFPLFPTLPIILISILSLFLNDFHIIFYNFSFQQGLLLFKLKVHPTNAFMIFMIKLGFQVSLYYFLILNFHFLNFLLFFHNLINTFIFFLINYFFFSFNHFSR